MRLNIPKLVGSPQIEARLPSLIGKGENLEFLKGAKILQIGAVARDDEEYLAVEYLTERGRRRLALFGFSELGLWLATEHVGWRRGPF